MKKFLSILCAVLMMSGSVFAEASWQDPVVYDSAPARGTSYGYNWMVLGAGALVIGAVAAAIIVSSNNSSSHHH